MLKVVSSITNSIGALNYKGTWNASTNSPALASGVGTKGDYYVVSVAGNTSLDGETNWGVGDWAVFNGTVWQKVDGGSTGNLTTLTVTGNTYLATTSGSVGVGTASPSYKLDVVGSTTTSRLGKLIIVDDSPFLTGANISSGAASLGIGTTSATNVTVFTNSVERLRVNSAGNVGIGTNNPGYQLEVVGSSATAKFGKLIVADDAPFLTGANLNSGAASLGIGSTGATNIVMFTNSVERFRVSSVGNVVAGGSVALATNATNGFLYVPTCAGTPTGTPTTITGMAPIVVDTTNNKLYFYSNSAWRDAGP